MINSKIAIFVITLILFSATMMIQDVYAGEQQERIAADTPLPNAIPDWVKTQFEWYVKGEIDEKTLLTSMNWMFDNNIMHLSQEAAQEVQALREKVEEQESAISSLRTLVSVNTLARESEPDDDGDDYSTSVYGLKGDNNTKGAIAIPNLLDARKSANESSAISSVATIDIPSMDGSHTKIFIASDENTDINSFVQWVLRESYLETNKDLQFHADKVQYYNELKLALEENPDLLNPQFLNPDLLNSNLKASKLIGDLVDAGVATESDWEDVIDQLATMQDYDTIDSVVDDLQGIVVLCSTAIDKEIYALQAEISLLQELSDMHSTDTIDRTAEYTSSTSSADSDLYDFQQLVSKKTTSIDIKIQSLQIGLKVLEEKLASVGDDAQLANIDLQNTLQKQQQTLQTMSNVSKMLHDTAMSVIRKIG